MLPIQINLPPNFIKSEVRFGYVIEEKLKKIWAVELDLLKRFIDLSSKHNIHFQIFAGTLLGAVRHKGFIPWDDDVDICMDRKNFKKLLRIANEFSEYPYYLQTPINDTKFYTPYIRFRNSATTAIIKWNSSPQYNNGIYIDIFVMDGFVTGLWRKIHDKVLEVSLRLYHRSCTPSIGRPRSFRDGLFRIFSPYFRPNRCIKLHQLVLGMMTPFARKLSLLTHSKAFSRKYWIFKSELNNTILLEFEGIKVPAPKEYDRVLSRIYGDYMKFPSESERGKWHENMIYFDPDTPYVETFRRGYM